MLLSFPGSQTPITAKTGELKIFIQLTDFNGADTIVNNQYITEWNEINNILTEMPLHIKASDQAGIQGNPIFDPVGTNEYIKAALMKLGWLANIPIPVEYSFLGTDIDFGKAGIIVDILELYKLELFVNVK